MSVIVISPDNFDTVRRILAALRRQTVAHELEIVFVSPDSEPAGLTESDVEPFRCHRSVATDDTTSTARMRALGTELASAPIIAFCEDHCFPAPDWARALIARHEGPWAGVGAVVENANPRTAVSWSNLLIEYGDWLAPHQGGPIHHIGGHNSSYKREVLLAFAEGLGSKLEAESTMQWELAQAGHRFYLEPAARLFHTNMEILGASVRSQFNGGRLFAANRCKEWRPPKRGLYFVGSPLIPLVRLAKCLASLRRIGCLWMVPRLLPSLGLLLLANGIGEMFGYGLGAGRSVQKVTEIEFHRERFTRRRERALDNDPAVAANNRLGS
ncbi:MAG: glycosyltransferase [Acidobacteriota bacterium]